MRILTFVLLAFAVACGGSDTPAPQTPAGNSDGEHADGEHADGDKHADGDMHADGDKHEHDFPAKVNAFHETLSPLWHAEAGDKRAADTCAAIASLNTAAAEVIAAPVPEKAAAEGDAWKVATEGLAKSVKELEAVCGDAARSGEFDAAFKAVHDAFHVLVGKIGHEEKG